MLEKHRHIVVANDGYDTRMNGSWPQFSKKHIHKDGDLCHKYRRESDPITDTSFTREYGNTGGSETRPRNIAFNYIVRRLNYTQLAAARGISGQLISVQC